MKLIVGLGNPGEKYTKTRHNIGFCVIDNMAQKEGIGFDFDQKSESEVGEIAEAKLAKPQTFMNNSGEAVSKIKNFYKIDDDDIIIIHDDVDLEIGKIRISLGGSSAGHKGVQSIIDHLGTDNFWRVRVGVGRDEKIPTEDWVLMNFEDNDKISKIIDETANYVIELLNKGMDNKTINVEA